MKFLIDMNLSPDWCAVLQQAGWDSVHWSAVGDPRATDLAIMSWASAHGSIVFTHDLDYGAILAATRAKGPSIVQIRAQDILPDHLRPLVIGILQEHEKALNRGAIISVDELRSRVRILPLIADDDPLAHG